MLLRLLVADQTAVESPLECTATQPSCLLSGRQQQMAHLAKRASWNHAVVFGQSAPRLFWRPGSDLLLIHNTYCLLPVEPKRCDQSLKNHCPFLLIAILHSSGSGILADEQIDIRSCGQRITLDLRTERASVVLAKV